jgi:hypothetical protein
MSRLHPVVVPFWPLIGIFLTDTHVNRYQAKGIVTLFRHRDMTAYKQNSKAVAVKHASKQRPWKWGNTHSPPTFRTLAWSTFATVLACSTVTVLNLHTKSTSHTSQDSQAASYNSNAFILFSELFSERHISMLEWLHVNSAVKQSL